MFEQELSRISPQAELEHYEYRLIDGGDTVDVTARINIPSHIQINQQDKTAWLQHIAKTIDMPASLSLQIVPLSPVARPSSVAEQEEVVRRHIQEVFAEIEAFTLLDFSIQKRDTSQSSYIVYIRYYKALQNPDAEYTQTQIENTLEEVLDQEEVSYVFLWDEVHSSPEVDQRYTRVLQDWDRYMTNV